MVTVEEYQAGEAQQVRALVDRLRFVFDEVPGGVWSMQDERKGRAVLQCTSRECRSLVQILEGVARRMEEGRW